MVADFENFDTFAIDLETTGLNPVDSRILLCQIGFGDKDYVIDARKVDLAPLLPFLQSKRWKKLLFNAKFENTFFQHFYQTELFNVFDCFLAERVIYPDNKWGNSFEDLALKYLNVQLDKAVRKSFPKVRNGEFSERQKKYAAEDVQYLFPLWREQAKLLEEKKLSRVAELEFELASVTASMELTGVQIDVPRWRGKVKEYENRKEESRQRMFSILFDDNNVMDEQMGMFERSPINLKSQPKLLDALRKIGLDIDNTDERTISQIDHPAARELLVYRKAQKVIDAYGESVLEKIHPFTGKIHAEFQQLGTETGRYSCKHPNLQQMPKEFRECFIAGKNYVFVGADYSQIELRILAEISNDPKLVAAFKSGHDVHKSTASFMFNVPQDSVTEDQRFQAKTLNFGIMYGMGPPKLMDTLNTEAERNGQPKINVRQAQAILNRYKATYRRATNWLDQVGTRALREGYAETLYGRKRFFNRPKDNLDENSYKKQISAISRQGANTPIQGTSADITKLAMLNLHRELKDFGFRGKIVLTVHDEIVVLAHKTQAESIKELVTDSMTRSAEQIIKSVPIKVDPYIAEIWKKG